MRWSNGTNQYTSGPTESVAPLTTAEIAKSVGVSPTVYKEEKQIARDILPEAQEAIKAADLLLQAGHPSIMYNGAFIMYEI